MVGAVDQRSTRVAEGLVVSVNYLRAKKLWLVTVEPQSEIVRDIPQISWCPRSLYRLVVSGTCRRRILESDEHNGRPWAVRALS